MDLESKPKIKNFMNTIWENCGSVLEKNQKNTQESKLRLKVMMENLNKGEYCYIFRIIINFNEKFTQNNNGVFIDLNSLSDECLEEISKYIDTVQRYKVKSGVKFIIQ